MPHIILFQNEGLIGQHMHVFTPFKNLNGSGVGFNDITSSFVILEGDWQFFKDWDYQTPFPLGAKQAAVFGPGVYISMSALGGGSNDSLSSLRPVQLVNGVWEPLPFPSEPRPIG
jgi:Beta/Gamma crystallin